MKKQFILVLLFLGLLHQLYPDVLKVFPDLARPVWLRINDGNVYISDQNSVFIYDLKSFELVERLGKRGEGPQEFESWIKIAFSGDRIFLSDLNKIVVYSKKNFKLIREIKLSSSSNRIIPVEKGFVLSTNPVIGGKNHTRFMLVDENLKPVECLLDQPDDPAFRNLPVIAFTHCRYRAGKVYIGQPHKGLYIDVFDGRGKKLYHIEKKVKEVKYEKKHSRLHIEMLTYFVGKRRVERARSMGRFNLPRRKYIPDFQDFWVLDDRVYVKTFDITDTKEKFIIMDLKGNIVKTVFLPKTFMEILTFYRDKFYYLEDDVDEESWVLHAVTF